MGLLISPASGEVSSQESVGIALTPATQVLQPLAPLAGGFLLALAQTLGRTSATTAHAPGLARDDLQPLVPHPGLLDRLYRPLALGAAHLLELAASRPAR